MSGLLWEGQRFETLRLGVVELVSTSERTPLVSFRCWGRRGPTGIERGYHIFQIPLSRLRGQLVRELVRCADLGGCWIDPAVVSDPVAVARWLSGGRVS